MERTPHSVTKGTELGNYETEARRAVSQDNGQRINQKTNVFASAFDDLTGPELYDPAWYNNKLRGEFGRLGSRQMSGPVLPKSYHLRSEDLDNFSGDGDYDHDEHDHPSRLIPQFNEVPSSQLNNNHIPYGRNKTSEVNFRTSSKIVSEQPSAAPPVINQLPPDNNSALVSSPITNEFDQIYTSKTATIETQAKQQPSESNAPQNNGNRKIRFSRKSGFFSHEQHQQSSQQQQSNRRQSRIFRASRLFMHSERDKDASGTGHRSMLRRSTAASKSRNASTSGTNNSFRPSSLSRKSVVFDWSCTPHDSLLNVRNLLENQYLGVVTLQKVYELRMQIPFCGESRTVAYQLVISVEEIRSGSRVSFRRSFADSLRGGGDEFDWLCAQIHEQLHQLIPTSHTTYS